MVQKRLGTRGISQLGNVLFAPAAALAVLPSLFAQRSALVLLTLCLAMATNASEGPGCSSWQRRPGPCRASLQPARRARRLLPPLPRAPAC